jgi:hypothetical protein
VGSNASTTLFEGTLPPTHAPKMASAPTLASAATTLASAATTVASVTTAAPAASVSTGMAVIQPVNYTFPEDRPRQGVVFDKWPLRLDIPVEYQDWILVGVTAVLVALWCMPCLCGRMRNKSSRSFASYLYTRLDSFFWCITYFNLIVLMCTIGILPDWTVNEYCEYFLKFITWVLLRLKKTIVSATILFGFALVVKFQHKIRMAAGLEHMTVVHLNWKEMFGPNFFFNLKKRPVELYLWKVEDLQATKIYKAHDLFIECHLGDNEPMRTRVHNNAGTGCIVKESFQINMNESETGTLMTLLVKDQSMVGSTEIARLNMSTREICGVEDATGKRRNVFSYTDDNFVELSMLPRGKIWIAIAPVCEEEDERQALLRESGKEDVMC